MTTYRHFYLSAVLLAIGILIYILFRQPVIFTDLLLDTHRQQPLIPLTENIWTYMLRYIAPDALWCTALLTYATSISNKMLKAVAVIMAPAMELCQLCGLIPGTFDIADLIAYILITIIFLLKWKNSNSDSQCLATV